MVSRREGLKSLQDQRLGIIIHYIREIVPRPDKTLLIVFADGVEGVFDVKPYIADEAFTDLQNVDEFLKVRNGGYFVEWECGADLSSDTLRSKIETTGNVQLHESF